MACMFCEDLVPAGSFGLGGVCAPDIIPVIAPARMCFVIVDLVIGTSDISPVLGSATMLGPPAMPCRIRSNRDLCSLGGWPAVPARGCAGPRSEEHTSELQS